MQYPATTGQPAEAAPALLPAQKIAAEIQKICDGHPDIHKDIVAAFAPFFEQANVWQRQAEKITITGEDDTAGMKRARSLRLTIREERIAYDKKREKVKESALRRSQIIDAVARVIRETIEPIEAGLKEKEDYAEIQAQKRKEILRQNRAAELKNKIAGAFNGDPHFVTATELQLPKQYEESLGDLDESEYAGFTEQVEGAINSVSKKIGRDRSAELDAATRRYSPAAIERTTGNSEYNPDDLGMLTVADFETVKNKLVASLDTAEREITEETRQRAADEAAKKAKADAEAAIASAYMPAPPREETLAEAHAAVEAIMTPPATEEPESGDDREESKADAADGARLNLETEHYAGDTVTFFSYSENYALESTDVKPNTVRELDQSEADKIIRSFQLGHLSRITMIEKENTSTLHPDTRLQTLPSFTAELTSVVAAPFRSCGMKPIVIFSFRHPWKIKDAFSIAIDRAKVNTSSISV